MARTPGRRTLLMQLTASFVNSSTSTQNFPLPTDCVLRAVNVSTALTSVGPAFVILETGNSNDGYTVGLVQGRVSASLAGFDAVVWDGELPLSARSGNIIGLTVGNYSGATLVLLVTWLVEVAT